MIPKPKRDTSVAGVGSRKLDRLRELKAQVNNESSDKYCRQKRKLKVFGELNMAKIFRTVSHKFGWSGLADYVVRENKVYRTVSHPLGWSGLPDYEIRNARLYRTVGHPGGCSGLPVYTIRNNQIYRTVSHEDGWGGLPDFTIR